MNKCLTSKSIDKNQKIAKIINAVTKTFFSGNFYLILLKMIIFNYQTERFKAFISYYMIHIHQRRKKNL